MEKGVDRETEIAIGYQKAGVQDGIKSIFLAMMEEHEHTRWLESVKYQVLVGDTRSSRRTLMPPDSSRVLSVITVFIPHPENIRKTLLSLFEHFMKVALPCRL